MAIGKNGLPIHDDEGPSIWDTDRADALMELRLVVAVVPVVGLLAWLATKSEGLHAMGRIFFSMWLHELGHAMAAWFTGFFALPGPWRTMVGDERSFGVVVGLSLLIAGLASYGHRTERRPLVVVAGVLMALQVVGHLIRVDTARAFISFFGDGGCMVIGALLVARFFAGPEEQQLTDDGPQRTWLRWGLVVIGAFALADASSVWWAAHGDPAEIPFGHIEGVGLSDPSVLVEQFHWSEQKLISRYVTTSALCLLLVGVCQVIGVRRAWLAWRET